MLGASPVVRLGQAPDSPHAALGSLHGRPSRGSPPDWVELAQLAASDDNNWNVFLRLFNNLGARGHITGWRVPLRGGAHTGWVRDLTEEGI